VHVKPRVLILIDTYYIGGAGKVLLQFVENADHSRFSCSLGNFRYKNPPSTEFIDAARTKGFDLVLFSQRFNLDPSPLWEAWKVIRSGHYNIIETHGYKGHLIAWALSRFLPIKWVGMTHGWTDENSKIRLYNRLEKWLLKRADHVISVSPQLAKTMQELRGPRGNVSLVLNAVDRDSIMGQGIHGAIRQRCGGNGTDAMIIGSFGRLSPEKGHAILIKACQELLQQKKLALILVGDGPEMENLKALTKSLKVEDQVFLEGQQDNMGDYYQAIDLFVLPSLSEGLPFVVLEAMAMGKPVLATDVGAISEVIKDGENGWIVPAGDSGALEARLNALIEDRQQLVETGRKAESTLYPRFAPKRQSDEVVTIYEEVVGASF